MSGARAWRRRALPITLLAVAAWQLGAGGYIHAKAWLAQRLIAHSWAERLADGVVRPPWPWADTAPVALLEVPRLGARAWVLDDASGRSLAFGPGHVGGSAPPGAPGASLIAGHRDTHFRFLRALRAGDALRLQAADGVWHRYTVRAMAVVDTGRGEAIVPPEGEALYLLTCYPFDAVRPGGALRYVVQATPAAAGLWQ